MDLRKWQGSSNLFDAIEFEFVFIFENIKFKHQRDIEDAVSKYFEHGSV